MQTACARACAAGGPWPFAAVLLAAALAGPVAAAAVGLLHALVLIITITAATLAGSPSGAVVITIRLRGATSGPAHHAHSSRTPGPRTTRRAEAWITVHATSAIGRARLIRSYTPTAVP